MVIFLVYPNPSPISLTQHPVMLRYTAGKKDKHNMSESINLLLCVLHSKI